MVTYRLYPAVRALAAMLPESHAYGPSAAYHAGCVALLEGDEDAAFASFAAFKRGVTGRDLPIGPESHFNVAYRQGTLIEDADWVEALGEGAPSPPIRWMGPPVTGTGPVLAAAADRHYFRLFGRGFVASIARHMPAATVHLHVVAPDADLAGQVAALQEAAPGLALNVSTEPAGAWGSGAYYASVRFLVAPALIARYEMPLALLDVDVELVSPLDEVLIAAGHAPFACFRHDGPGPCSRYPAVFTLWNDGSAELLDRVGRFLRAKLDIPWPHNWMLDQAALASAMRWARRYRPDLALCILNDRLGRHFQPWMLPLGHEAKARLIRDAG
jgi:hypothetical protein